MRSYSQQFDHSQGPRILLQLLAVLIISLCSAFLLAPAWEGSYAVIHTLLETLCIVIALSSFLVVWYVSTIQHTNLILGFGFLGVAIFDALHTFFWQGFDLFTGGYYDLSARFWLAGRLFEALALVLSTASVGRLAINRYAGLAFAILFPALAGVGFYYSPNAFPLLLTPTGMTPVKIFIEYIIISLFVWFLYRVYKGHFREDIVTKKYLVLAVVTAVPAELCFTLFTTVTSFYNVLGHVLKLSYYYFFLRAVFTGYVVFPYQAIRRSEERFHTVFQNSPVLKAILAKQDGRFIDVNGMWLQETGYMREEVIGRTAQELNLYPSMVKVTSNGASDGRMLTNQRYQYRTKYGVLREGVYSTQEIVLQNTPCILMVTMDVTDQAKNEKELLRLDRLNMVGEMAAGIAHEVRNPMTTVRGFLQMLAIKQECLAYKGYFDLMIEELDRANAIITEFLSLAKKQLSDLAPLNINTILHDLYPLLKADAIIADKDVHLEAFPVPDIWLNRGEIHQLVLNLVKNGLEAMERGGTVSVVTRFDGEEIVLSIKDEGKGIAQDALDKIGTPFFTTKEQGTGLGLATCYRIAERHNARIEVDSRSDGTTFIVRFRTSALNMEDNAAS